MAAVLRIVGLALTVARRQLQGRFGPETSFHIEGWKFTGYSVNYHLSFLPHPMTQCNQLLVLKKIHSSVSAINYSHVLFYKVQILIVWNQSRHQEFICFQSVLFVFIYWKQIVKANSVPSFLKYDFFITENQDTHTHYNTHSPHILMLRKHTEFPDVCKVTSHNTIKQVPVNHAFGHYFGKWCSAIRNG